MPGGGRGDVAICYCLTNERILSSGKTSINWADLSIFKRHAYKSLRAVIETIQYVAT